MSQTTQPDGTGVSALYVKQSDGTFVPVIDTSGNIVTTVTPGDIPLARSQILVGNSSGVATAVTAGNFAIAVKTNGTTPVNLFGTTNGFAGTITSVSAISQDGTAGTITVATSLISGGAATKIADSIVKGAIGATTGTIMTATAFTSAGTTTVVSSSGGNAIVTAIFTVS